MQKTNKAPDIRYDINANNWEFMAFKEVFDITVPNNSLSRAELNYESGYIKSIHYGDILIKYKSYVNCNIDEIPYITNGNISKYRNQILKDGDIIFADAAEDETVGKAVELVNVEKSYIVSGLHTIVFRPNIKFGKYWLGYYINSKKFHQQLLPLMQGTKVLSLNKKSISETYLIFPKSLKEQESIGYFFYFLDNMISYQQIFLKKLEDLKQSMLEKMFPKQGQTVPEIRFRGFTDNWNKSKLDKICTRLDHLRVPVAENLRIKGSTPYYGANGIQDYVDGFTHDGEYVLIAEDGANDLKDYPIYYVKGKIWVNNHAHVIQGKKFICDNKFLAYVTKKCDFSSIIVGGSRSKLNAITMMNIIYFIPSIQEQKKIAEYFSNLDNLITLNEKKLEKLQNIKKFFLEKMFV